MYSWNIFAAWWWSRKNVLIKLLFKYLQKNHIMSISLYHSLAIPHTYSLFRPVSDIYTYSVILMGHICSIFIFKFTLHFYEYLLLLYFVKVFTIHYDDSQIRSFLNNEFSYGEMVTLYHMQYRSLSITLSIFIHCLNYENLFVLYSRGKRQ